MFGLAPFGGSALGAVPGDVPELWCRGAAYARPAIVGGWVTKEIETVAPGAAVLYRNLADEGVVTATSWIPAAPPTLLQQEHTSRMWRGDIGAAESIILRFSEPQVFDTVALLRCTKIVDGIVTPMTEAAASRVRVSSTDPTGVSGDLLDTFDRFGAIRPQYEQLVLFTDQLTAMTVRIDLAEADAEALMAGRLVVGLRNRFTINFSYGWSQGYQDLSRRRRNPAGLTFIDRERRYRMLDLSFEFMTPEDRYGMVEEIDRLCGVSRDILFVTDQASVQPDRDTVWGLISDLSPPTQPHLNFFSKRYMIEERL